MLDQIKRIPSSGVDCKGVYLFVLQGGVHWHYKSSFTAKWVKYFLKTIHDATAGCKTPPHVHYLFLGGTSQSRDLDKKYPAQTRENVRKYNAELDADFAELGSNFHFWDLLPLTTDAQTSDGFHSLTDVNVAEAFSMLHFMSLIAPKGG
jgi:hypothetical protein